MIIPRALALLELKEGERVLDLGSGQGVFSRTLRAAGARVTGVDSSENLVRMARQHEGHGIEYFVGDARRMLFLDSESFDVVACLLAIQNMNPVAPVIAEAARVLKPGGRMVLVMNHPCFRIPRQSGWGWEEDRKLQFRRIDRYMTEMKVPIQTHPGDAPQQITWTYHMPLSGYVRALSENGLYVDALEEWTSPRESQPGPRASAENLARQEIPLFLALRAVKLRQPERPPVIVTPEPVGVPATPATEPAEATAAMEKKPRRRATTTKRATAAKAPTTRGTTTRRTRRKASQEDGPPAPEQA